MFFRDVIVIRSRRTSGAGLELHVILDDPSAHKCGPVRLLRATQAELAGRVSERRSCYRWVDHGSVARSLPGFGEVGAAARPRASETGDTDRKG